MATACAIAKRSSTVMIFPLDRIRSGTRCCARTVEAPPTSASSAAVAIVCHVSLFINPPTVCFTRRVYLPEGCFAQQRVDNFTYTAGKPRSGLQDDPRFHRSTCLLKDSDFHRPERKHSS